MTQPFVLFWTLLFAIHSTLVPLELTLARMPNGRALAASLHNVSAGVNAVLAAWRTRRRHGSSPGP